MFSNFLQERINKSVFKTQGGLLMNLFRMLMLAILTFSSNQVFARGGGGGHAFGGGLALVNPGQNDLDATVDEVNAANAIAVNKLGAGYELYGHYTYKFSGTIFALQFRPSYIMQNATGAGYDLKMTGLTLFPIFQIIPLENDFIKFRLQVGLGYGTLSGEFSGGGNSVGWKGSAFGALGGLGADFCFTDNHCMAIEGNLRYLPFERNLVTSVSGTSAALGFDAGIVSGGELENGNKDVGTSLSGIQGLIGYTYSF
jgi:hypothetical protein